MVRRSLTWAALVVLAGAAAVPAVAPGRGTRAVEAALAYFEARAGDVGLAEGASALRAGRSRRDARGFDHVRFQQFYQKVLVFEGEAIAEVAPSGAVVGVTNALRPSVHVDTDPALDSTQAIESVIGEAQALGDVSIQQVRLEVLPQGERSERDRLVWHVTAGIDDAVEGPAQWEYFVDAHSGETAFSYNSLETTASLGTGRTMYSGNQTVNTDSTSSTFFLRDLTRGGGNFTCDLRNGTSSCATFSRTNNVFGNNVKDSSDRATAGADAHFGLQKTWDFYRSTFGRNGIDNSGRRTFSRVHYGVNYQNAFWSNSCFCMTYGDGGSTFYPLVAIDVAGHEMSHGVMSTEANLTYAGESGGLNESNSDIFGTMVEFFANSAADLPDWWIGERILRSNYASGRFVQSRALRYMDDPAKDGRSPACWSSTLGSLDVHLSSGPNNHMFYLLANGGTSRCNGRVVAGIGRAKAARIWYDAIANRMTSSTNYARARTACLASAAALFGSGSPERAAVAAAYSAINVN